MVLSDITLNGELVVSDKTVYLGHTVSTTDRDCITIVVKNNFYSFNLFIAYFGQLYCYIKI